MNSTEEDDFNKNNEEETNEESINRENIIAENINSDDNKIEANSMGTEEKYRFGWSDYSEVTNGRFAMLGFLALILIELFSQQTFLAWAGIS